MANYTTYAYGHDFGNARTCGMVYINGAIKSLTNVSCLRSGTYKQLAHAAVGDLRKSDILNEYSHTLRLNGKEYYVGNLAIEQAKKQTMSDLTGNGMTQRYWSAHNLALLLSVSGTLIPEREYGLYIVTGLPIETYEDENNVESVKNTLDGDHVFTLDGEERVAHVTVKKVLMEGSGANIAHGVSGNAKVGIVDIGSRTTDIYMAYGQRVIPDFCHSHDQGVSDALEIFEKAFSKKHRYTFQPADTDKLQRLYTNGQDYSQITAVGNRGVTSREVESLLEDSLHEVAEGIVAFIKQKWGGSLQNDTIAADVSRIILVGGGAYYFDREMRALFPRILTVPAQPECSNAAGYSKLASHLMAREPRLAMMA